MSTARVRRKGRCRNDVALVESDVGSVVVAAELHHPGIGSTRRIEERQVVVSGAVGQASRATPTGSLGGGENVIRHADLAEFVVTFVRRGSFGRLNDSEGRCKLVGGERAEPDSVPASIRAR